MKTILNLFILIVLGASLSAQYRPITEVYELELNVYNTPKKLSLLSNFNPDRYNNHPHYIDKNRLMIACEDRQKDQTDIFLLNTKTKERRQLTATSVSEYSPQVYLDDYFTVVLVDQPTANSKNQKLWQYPISLKNSGEQLVHKIDNFALYKHLPNLKLAVLQDDPETPLVVANVRNNLTALVCKNAGKSFVVSKNGTLYYLEKSGERKILKTYNSINGTYKTITKCLKDAEDIALYGANQEIIMSKGPEIYKYNTRSNSWELFLNLSPYGIKRITRLTSKGNKIAFVNFLRPAQ